jgi:hypothetical protein
MRFESNLKRTDAHACLLSFVELCGTENWRKRSIQLHREATRSFPLAKIVHDYHWLEFIIGQLVMRRPEEISDLKRRTASEHSALQFVIGLVEIAEKLSSVARDVLSGRLRDALKTDSGLAPLHLEIETALLLMADGFEVDWPDLNGCGSADLSFSRDALRGEVECKSISADAGRKIHRREFYRFISQLDFSCLREDKTHRVILATLEDRFPTAGSMREYELRSAIQMRIEASELQTAAGEGFTVRQDSLDEPMRAAAAVSEEAMYSAFQKAYGQNVHLSGVVGADCSCLIAMRSQRQDDTSLPILDAMKKAVTQLEAPNGLISVQCNDLHPDDLMRPNVRERMGLLANYLFHSRDSEKIAAVNFCGYAGLYVVNEGTVTPSLVVLNPRFAGKRDGLPFHGEILGVAERPTHFR